MEFLNVIDIKTHELNPNQMGRQALNKLKELIIKEQNYPPLIVNKRDGKYILVDGHQRLQVIKEIGFDQIKCDIWEVDYETELMLLATLNQLHGNSMGKKKELLYEELKKHTTLEMIKKLSPENKEFLSKVLDDVVERKRSDLKLPEHYQMIQMLTREEYSEVSEYIELNYDNAENSIYLMFKYIIKMEKEINERSTT